MERKSVLSQCGKALIMLPFMALCVSPLAAQVMISSQTPYSANFNDNTLPVSGSGNWANNSTIQGWYAGPAVGSSSTITADNGTSATAGLKSLGVAGSTDRALGSISTTTDGGYYYGVRLYNNTGDVIRNFRVEFKVELWAKAQGKQSTSISLDYQTGVTVTSLTAGTWLPATKYVANITSAGGQAATYDGNTLQTAAAFDINNIELAPGQEIMFRLFDANESKLIYLGIDDVVITPSGQSNVFYSRAGADPSLAASWGTNSDGTGTAPANFTLGYQSFVVRSTSTVTANPWTISGTNSKLVVGEGVNAVELTIANTGAFVGTVDVQDNATLTINSATLPTLGVLEPLSTVNFNSTATTQTVPVADYANLFVGNANKKLIANTRVRKNLKLNNAKLELNNSDLLLDANATISGADASSFIVTKGTGRVKREVKNNNVSVVFPVGTDRYMPVTIKQNSAGTTDFFSVKAIDGVYDSYTNNQPSGTAYTTKGVNKTWIIDEDVTGDSDVEITIQWNQADELPGFDLTKARLSHYENGVWDNPNPVTVSYDANGVATITRSGIMSFSPFNVDSRGPAMLPVELISFEASVQKDKVVCNWQTAMELNNNYFTVERSSDGKTFSEIGNVKGAGSTTQISVYQFADARPLTGTAYYRLRQTDFDGTTSYSKIVAVNVSSIKNALAFDVFPNPAAGLRYVNTNAELTGPALVTISNVQGQIISKTMVAPENLKAGFGIDLKKEPKGLYFITINTGNEVVTLRTVQL